jgi:peptidyl-Asp metalloendopeptidase
MRAVRPLIVLLLLVGSLLQAGCTRTSASDAMAQTALNSTASAPRGAAPPSGRHGTGFASLPDRGDLLGYPARRVVRQERASTWYRADVSEEHALQAVVTGEMTITAPDGQPIHLRYQRHFEHPNGNWTWIGRNENGEEAIVTFGEKAVFGSIPRDRRGALRLATSGGHAWVVETDPGKEHYPRGRRHDYLVPPELVGSFASNEPTVASASAEAVATAAAGTTIDLALGYTSGFANELGGNSQAVTRLQNLVDITNQAYSNSQINARIRLVRTVLVSYTDSTDNNDALEKLSGYKSGTGTIPIDPAFNALRSARDQYGADLVSLVRRFRTPENKGCGVAWLIGNNQSGIDNSDARWGYSIVSDDLDRGDLDETDKKTYICRKETLAHELGHSMGQAHNVEDSDEAGAHAYSYGYREASTSGFFTIMAYKIEGSAQFSIPYFANPHVTYAGRPTGTVNADNVRSLTQTLPIIAGFRASVVNDGSLVAGIGDFSGDGASDILWRDAGSGENSIWRSGNPANAQALTTVADLNWSVASVADFDGNGASDILWRHGSTGGNAIWKSASSGTQQAVATASPTWRVAGAGDFNGDGRADILWRNSSTGANVIWRSANSATGQQVTTVALGWSVAGIADFDGDSRADILWRNTHTGANVIWKAGSSSTQQAVATVADQTWQVVGTGDFNGDGRFDILWRNNRNGRNAIWKSANAATQQVVTTVSDQAWKVAGVGEFNADGRWDILWRYGSTGTNTIWLSGNSATQQPANSAL